jgi:transposase
LTFIEGGLFRGIKKRDGRKLTTREQHLIRETAVTLYFEQGCTKLETAVALGVSRQNVGKWCTLYEEGGVEALKLGRRGRRQGEQTRLKDSQCRRIVNSIKEKTPDQLKMPFVLWTAAAVRDLTFDLFGIMLSLRTMRKYLARWEFTPQKPLRKAWQQSSACVRKWLEEEYPVIARSAKARGATIYWVDETGVTNQSNSQRGYAPKGQTPPLKHGGTKRKVNMISALTNKGEVRFMCYTSMMSQSKFILFLSKLIRSADGPVVVITDNLPVHHGKRVARWVADQKGAVELKFIPSYSPELNADEYLNRDLKKNVHSRKMQGTLAGLKANISSFMHSIQKQPGRVKRYFLGRHISYAAS